MVPLDYLCMVREVKIFVDHENLIYIYDPYGPNHGISGHTAIKLKRLAITISYFRYLIEHFPDENSLWGDILNIWFVRSTRTIIASKTIISHSLMFAPINPLIVANLYWPTFQDIFPSQQALKDPIPKGFTKTDEGYKNTK